MHYYKRNLGDYAKKAGRLSMLQHGAYTLLLDACYDRECFPTEDQAIEWTWASTPDEEQAVRFVLSRFFQLQDDGTYLQTRVYDEIQLYKVGEIQNRLIALAREARKQNRPVFADACDRLRAEIKNEPLSKTHAAWTVVIEALIKEHEAPPNQEPITNNQEPIDIHTENPSESAGADPCPHQAIVDLFHEVLPELARVRDITTKRQTQLRSRWRQDKRFQSLDWWRKYFSVVRESDFLMGRSKDWQADFDFLINASKFQKIIEGGYQNGGGR